MSEAEAADRASESSDTPSAEFGFDSSGDGSTDDEFVGCEPASGDEEAAAAATTS